MRGPEEIECALLSGGCALWLAHGALGALSPWRTLAVCTGFSRGVLGVSSPGAPFGAAQNCPWWEGHHQIPGRSSRCVPVTGFGPFLLVTVHEAPNHCSGSGNSFGVRQQIEVLFWARHLLVG